MNKKDTLVNLLDFAIETGERLETALTDAEKSEIGTFETWSVKDMLAHVAYWLDRDLGTLDMKPGTIPVIPEDEIDEKNRAVFDSYSSKSWGEVAKFYRATFEKTRGQVTAMQEADLLRELERSDGTKRQVWRQISGHALSHMTAHFAMVYRRRGENDQATQLEEQTATLLKGLDDSAEWLAAIQYNLACHYALSGQRPRALDHLTDALRLDSSLKSWARKDSDFDSIRESQEFKSICDE